MAAINHPNSPVAMATTEACCFTEATNEKESLSRREFFVIIPFQLVQAGTLSSGGKEVLKYLNM